MSKQTTEPQGAHAAERETLEAFAKSLTDLRVAIQHDIDADDIPARTCDRVRGYASCIYAVELGLRVLARLDAASAQEPQGWQPGPPPILPIIVWPWRDAPQEYRALSTHGGDEDWVAFVLDGYPQPMWMESGTAFGCCDVCGYVVDGGRVFIGAHA